MATTPAELCISAGQVQLYRLLDVAEEIDLVEVERSLRSRTGDLSPSERAIRLRLERLRDAVVFTNPPVTARLADRSVTIGPREWPVMVDARVYDFGAMTIAWTLPIPEGMTLDQLEQLSVELEAPPLQAQLAEWMDADAQVALDVIASGLHDAGIRPLSETFTIYCVRRFSHEVGAEQLRGQPALLGVLLGEHRRFSQHVRDEMERASFTYAERDLTVIGYDQAFVYDVDGTNDVSLLLEFALAQVLELQYYDRLLDQRLAASTEAIGRSRSAVGRFGFGRSRFERLRQDLLLQHVDFTEVLERVTSAVKVTEDFYYATIYRAAMRVFGADELVAATNRKLDLVFRTYSMLADEVDTQKSHRLEWIVIFLIAFEIVLTLAERL